MLISIVDFISLIKETARYTEVTTIIEYTVVDVLRNPLSMMGHFENGLHLDADASID